MKTIIFTGESIAFTKDLSKSELGLIKDFAENKYGKIISEKGFGKVLNLTAGQWKLIEQGKNSFEMKPARFFEGPFLDINVEIQKEFSIAANIRPKKEFAYGFVNDYAKDEYFKQETFKGKSVTANLQIVKTRDGMTTDELIKLAGKELKNSANLSKFAVRALHKILREQPEFLDSFKDRAIVVPIKSDIPGSGGRRSVLYLYWNAGAWVWLSYWASLQWGAGVHVVLLSQ